MLFLKTLDYGVLGKKCSELKLNNDWLLIVSVCQYSGLSGSWKL